MSEKTKKEPQIEVRTVSHPGAPKKEEVPGLQWLRQYASTVYVTSLEDISVRSLSSRPEFSGVQLRTLERWCVNDDWVGQRADYFTRLKNDIESQLGERVVSTRVETLEKMSGLMELALDKLEKGIVEPHSFEGMVSAIVRLADLREKLLDKIMAGIGPLELGGKGSDPTRIRPNLSDDEMRAMIETVLDKRRKLQREKANGQGKTLDKA